MAQIFSPKANVTFRAALAFLVLAAVLAAITGFLHARSNAVWNVGSPAQQPIPFRHDIHAGMLQLDCRHCHSAVERSAQAGMPTAQTCMSCHSQVWVGADALAPLRTAASLDLPIRWTSVHRLPEFAYFHHGIHLASGLDCGACHGPVDRMARTVKTERMSMGWCLDCHRNPEERSARRQAVSATHTGTEKPADDPVHRIAAARLIDCTVCHR